MVVGKIIGGESSGHILIRVKNEAELSVGDLVIAKDNSSKYYLKIIDLKTGSLIPDKYIESIAGHRLERGEGYKSFDSKEKFFNVAKAKMLKVKEDGEKLAPRKIPGFFTDVRRVTESDFEDIGKGGIPIGDLRLGNDVLDVGISLPAEDLIRHHILIVAATGKGKSNFAKVFAKGLLEHQGHASLIFDPHAEYYGEGKDRGLKEHPQRDQLEYFTPEDVVGSEPLKIHTQDLCPSDFHGILSLSSPQKQAMDLAYKKFGEDWIQKLMTDTRDLEEQFGGKIKEATLEALSRKIGYIMEIDGEEGFIFSLKKRERESLFKKVKQYIKDGETVIFDTSLVGDKAERLIANSVVGRVFNEYRFKRQKQPEVFRRLPEVMILFEEAPRVIGKRVLNKGTNIFERVAREGRKFKVGLAAITQMPSLLPKEILSQINTKVIMGLPAPADRRAVIESSSQNIEDEETEIQMLDVGEAIVTSPFIPFPLPTKIHHFPEVIGEGGTEDINVGIG